ncbi:AAA family ATPase [Bacillus cereus]|nr:AAA family ATPase [Bacillus cereus]
MKLLYCWFEKYKQLKDFEANLGNEFIFNYSEKKFTINDNKLFIKDFFKLPNKDRFFKLPNYKDLEDIQEIDISAIVGENGSGKSTVLDFLSELMSKNSIDSNYILVYSLEKKLHIFSTIQNEITFENKTSKAIYFCLSPLNFQKHLTLLFSNVFDARSIGMLSENEKIYYKNITTNFLISRHRDISYFLRSEFEKQIFFIHEYKEQLNLQNLMKIPSKIFLEMLLDENSIPDTDEVELGLKFLEDDEVAMEYFDFPVPNEFYKSFYANCLRLFIVHVDFLILEYQVRDSVPCDYEEFLYFYSSEHFESVFDGIHQMLKDDLPDGYYESDEEFDDDSDEEQIPSERKLTKEEKIKSFYAEVSVLKEDFKNLCECFKKMKFGDIDTRPYILTESSETKNFITLYQKALSKVGCIEFTWSDMSSGEYGMLSLFSRFHHILKCWNREQENLDREEIIENKGEFKENALNLEESTAAFPSSYLLLIDEGDLYFHPQWQKDWLYYFIKLSGLLFKGDIQIILTTHSPFVLSDFPNTNVVFLKSDDQASVSPSFLEGSPKTFASNIIELFSNSFFIKDGLIGRFAKEKINQFIQSLLKLTPEEAYLHRDEIKRFIDTIGEPLIRNKTLQIYQGKLELHNDFDIEKRILLLEQELKNLKDKRKF